MKKFKLAGLFAALALLGSSVASAVVIDFGFLNAGTITGSAPVSTTSGWVFSSAPSLSGWKFASTLNLVESSPYNFDIMESSNWKFYDNAGNSFEGTLFGKLAGETPDAGGGVLHYLITGGTGNFLGAAGSGASAFGFLAGFFTDFGKMTVYTPPVPEPGTTALFAAGLALIAFAAYRRRRAIPQR